MSRLPDHDARLRALTDHGSTLLVEAGAGSGKTALMAGRVVLLLAAGVKPRRIAAITFTELAAGELFTRVNEFRDRLLDGVVPVELAIALPAGPDAAQRDALAEARQRIGELVITTIHGFCQALIRPYPVEAGMDPGARVMDPQATALAWEDRVYAFLRERLDCESPSGAVAAYVAAVGPGAERRLVKWAESLRTHRTARPADAPDVRRALDDFCRGVDGFADFVGRTRIEEQETQELVRVLGELAEKFQGRLAADDLVGLIRCSEEPFTCTAHTQKLTWRKWGHKGRWQKAAAAAGHSKAEAGRLSDEARDLYVSIGEAWQVLQSAVCARAFAAVATELREVLSDYGKYKREAALLDFDDLLHLARDLVERHPEVREALAERYAHVLVDEFQDTDPLQAEILWRLCGDGDADIPWARRKLRPGALFCVGDPKQAIYRFRGADVDTYVTAREAIRAQHPGHILAITANFRSLAPILEWVNDRFREPLSALEQPGFEDLSPVRQASTDQPCVIRLDLSSVGPRDDEGIAGDDAADTAAGARADESGTADEVADEVTRQKADPVDSCSDDGAGASLLDGLGDAARLREEEAAAVAGFCERIIGRLEIGSGTKRSRRLLPGDIALLAPGGTALWRYERALERMGIPVASQAGKGFFRRQEIQDLIALARTLADPADTVALGALLRGPLVGLTEETLLDIVAGLPGPAHGGLPQLRLWTDPEQVNDQLAAERLRTLQGLARQASSTTPFHLLAQAVEELRVRALLRARHPGGAERAMANVDLFLEMARPYGVRGLKSFAADMRARWEDSESQVEGRPDAEEQAVHLITMHSAKGLEWPVVILVNTATGSPSRGQLLHDRATDELHFSASGVVTPAFERLKEKDKAQDEREDLRLLYVACTRASELLVLPNLPQGKSKWLKLTNRLAIPELPVFDEARLVDANIVEAAAGNNGQSPDVFRTEAARIATATRYLHWRQPSRHEGSPGTDHESAAPASPEAGMDDVVRLPVYGGPVRGQVLHKLMEEVLFGFTADADDTLRARASTLLLELGEAVAEDAADGCSPAEMAGTIRRTLALPDLEALRAEGAGRPRLEPEFPVFRSTPGTGGDVVETITVGIADLVAFDASGEPVLLIDWKSDPQPVDETRAHYRQQMREYLNAIGAPEGLLVYMTPGRVERVRP